MITVTKPTPQEAEQMRTLPTWGCEISTFKWSYNSREVCLLIKGKVKVTYESEIEGVENVVEFGAGDMVTFAEGLQCVWHVTEEVEKYYKFE